VLNRETVYLDVTTVAGVLALARRGKYGTRGEAATE
jgi:hypothetical protein